MELLRKIALKICLVLVLSLLPAAFSLAELVAQQSSVVRGKVSDISNEPIATHYYNPIAQERIFENSNLVQNPGYN